MENKKNLVFKAVSCLDRGKKRESNQDNLFAEEGNSFFVVSDGVGSSLKGLETSEMVVDKLPKAVAGKLAEGATIDDLPAILLNEVVALSNYIFELNPNKKDLEYGATVVCALVAGNKAIVAHLGDSRCYLVRNGKLEKKTNDHNMAGLLVKYGELTEDEAWGHPSCNNLLRFVGMKPRCEPEAAVIDILAGDMLILCSDGVHGMLKDKEIESVIAKNNSFETIAQDITNASNEAGGKDNISIIVIKFSEVGGEVKNG